jgi:transketolase
MLHEALLASELLADRKFGLRIVNLPWLNRVDLKWLEETISPFEPIFVVEDHAPQGGLTDYLLRLLTAVHNRRLMRHNIYRFAVDGYPACGTPAEALTFHRLDGTSLARRVLEEIG